MSDYTRHTKLVCHAPHPDPAKRGERCGYTLVDSFPGKVEFERNERHYPEPDREHVAARCSRKSCLQVNVFRLLESTASIASRRY
jgi:hypothetical protein